MNTAIIACLLVASIGAILLLLTRLLRAGAGTAPEAPPTAKISASRLAEISARVAAARGALALIRDATEDGGIRFTVQALMDDRAPLAMDYLEHALEDYADLAADLVAAREELQALRRAPPKEPALGSEESRGLDVVRERLRRRAMERIQEAATGRSEPGLIASGPGPSPMEEAARAGGLEGADLTRAMLLDVHGQVRRALVSLDGVARAGYLAGGASWSRQAAEERLIEAKAHLDRALEDQDRMLRRSVP